MSFGFIIAWYAFCAILISLVVFFIRGFSFANFRDEDGDANMEIGYDHDSVGRFLKHTPQMGCTESRAFVGQRGRSAYEGSDGGYDESFDSDCFEVFG